MYTIYKRTLPDDTTYIGCTSQTLERRSGPKGAGYVGSAFYKALEQWDWSDVVTEVLAVVETVEEAREQETAAIAEFFKTHPREQLLNMQLTSSYGWSDDNKQHLSLRWLHISTLGGNEEGSVQPRTAFGCVRVMSTV